MHDNNTNIEKLNHLEVSDWIIWLKKVSRDYKAEPTIIFGDITFDRKILLIKNEFETRNYSTEKLSKAIFALFSELRSNKNNSEEIYYLIQLLAVFKNQEFAPELENIFLRGDLATTYYKGLELNVSLLNALFNFKSIQDLSEYFHNILHENKKPIYYLLGLKFYCKTKPVSEYFTYLNFVADKFIISEYAEQIGSGIVNSLNELSYLEKGREDIFRWWTSKAQKYKTTNEIFFRVIRDEFSKWLNDRNKTVLTDFNLLNLKTFNDSLVSFNPQIFNEYTKLLNKKAARINQAIFENCSVALENYIADPKAKIWEAFNQNEIEKNTTKSRDKIKLREFAYSCQKTIRAFAISFSSRKGILGKTKRAEYKKELLMDIDD